MLLLGDCLERLKEIPDNHIDAVVTDPPYGLSFMGKKWDYEVPSVEIWREVFRVLKPGGHLLSFAGTRTYHRMAVNIEDAGFEVRDMVSWIYGQGFPKSRDISKDFDKIAGVKREVVGVHHGSGLTKSNAEQGAQQRLTTEWEKLSKDPVTDLAKQWAGWGTALKPALEPVCLARKPLIGTVVENVKEHGTGGLNIDGSRIGAESTQRVQRGACGFKGDVEREMGTGSTNGRWPSNVILDEEAGRVLDEQSGISKSTDRPRNNKPSENVAMSGPNTGHISHGHSDSGGASRFFYCAKVSSKERNAGLEGMPKQKTGALKLRVDSHSDRNGLNAAPRANHHPTVKPVKLMEYLCKLVTPPGGIVLDPFMGSGSTGIAAMSLGFRFIGIEREEEYLKIAEARISSKADIERRVKTNLVRK